MTCRRKVVNAVFAGVLMAASAVGRPTITGTAAAFTLQPTSQAEIRGTFDKTRASPLYLANCNNGSPIASPGRVAGTIIATAALGSAVALSPLGDANAYDPSDYASETVTAAVSSLKEAEGDAKKSFQAFEEIAAIIAEGKGIGGSVNYSKYYVVCATFGHMFLKVHTRRTYTIFLTSFITSMFQSFVAIQMEYSLNAGTLQMRIQQSTILDLLF